MFRQFTKSLRYQRCTYRTYNVILALHRAYISKYLHFRYLKCLVINCSDLWEFCCWGFSPFQVGVVLWILATSFCTPRLSSKMFGSLRSSWFCCLKGDQLCIKPLVSMGMILLANIRISITSLQDFITFSHPPKVKKWWNVTQIIGNHKSQDFILRL